MSQCVAMASVSLLFIYSPATLWAFLGRVACFCVQNCWLCLLLVREQAAAAKWWVFRGGWAQRQRDLMRKLRGTSQLVLSSLSDVRAVWEMVVKCTRCWTPTCRPWRVPGLQGRNVSQSLSISDLGACKSQPCTPRSVSGRLTTSSVVPTVLPPRRRPPLIIF